MQHRMIAAVGLIPRHRSEMPPPYPPPLAGEGREGAEETAEASEVTGAAA